MKQSQKRTSSPMRACGKCLGKYRAGYIDGTEGLAHVWDEILSGFIVCLHCDGTGKE